LKRRIGKSLSAGLKKSADVSKAKKGGVGMGNNSMAISMTKGNTFKKLSDPPLRLLKEVDI